MSCDINGQKPKKTLEVYQTLLPVREWGLGTRLTADAIEYGTESFKGKEILDNLIVEGPKKLVKNWSNIDTWPGHLPYRTVESIPTI